MRNFPIYSPTESLSVDIYVALFAFKDQSLAKFTAFYTRKNVVSLIEPNGALPLRNQGDEVWCMSVVLVSAS